jgi:recombination protein RecT
MTTIVQARDQQATKPTLAQTVEMMRPEIARALPSHMNADRMARLALTTIRQTPKLAECTPASFLGALLTASALGLEPGINGEAYLVPHGRECTLIVGYAGLAKLFFQHPDAQHLDAQVVYERDDFDYAYGLDPYLTHKPALGDRGKVVAFYAVAALKSGARLFTVLSPEDVKALRGGKTGTSVPDPMHWMARKTVLRQLLKLLPKSTTLHNAMAVDERSGTELHSTHAPEQITSGHDLIDSSTGEVLEIEAGEEPDPS